jgi:hypothetical protein
MMCPYPYPYQNNTNNEFARDLLRNRGFSRFCKLEKFAYRRWYLTRDMRKARRWLIVMDSIKRRKGKYA